MNQATTGGRILLKPGQAQNYLGITRNVLAYWVSGLKLIRPAEVRPGQNLFDFGNLLNLGLIKTLTDVGIRATELVALMNIISPTLGPDWELIKKIIRARRAAGTSKAMSMMMYISLDLHIHRTGPEVEITSSIIDRKKTWMYRRIKNVNKRAPRKGNVYCGEVNIGIPLNLIIQQAIFFAERQGRAMPDFLTCMWPGGHK